MNNEEKAKVVVEEAMEKLPAPQDMKPEEWVQFIINIIVEHPFMFVGLGIGAFIDMKIKNRKKNDIKTLPNTNLKVIKGGK